MKTIITDGQRGLKFKSGKFVKMLKAGKYHSFGDERIEVLSLEDAVKTSSCTLNTLLENRELAAAVTVVEVADQQIALRYVEGKFAGVLRTGKYAFWNDLGKQEFTLVDTSDPKVDESIPTYIFSKIPSLYYTKIEVTEHEKARLYYDQKLMGLLDAGTYYFWKGDVKVEATLVDTRLLQMDIAGQEILTQDKVTLRVNFVCNYRITDYVKIVTEIDDYGEQIHVAAQLALREYIGKHKLDEILENKAEMSEFVFGKLKEKEAELYISVKSADVKDIILPGEIREIMNTVLVAEKRAQANVITRREEVASTRSLLNTAKLMEENPTLYKLKELEYVERICENVGSIHLNGSGDMLTQLCGLLQGK